MRDTLYFSKLRVFLAGWRWRLQRFRPSQWRRWQRTHRTICSPRSASLFTLEPLESRLLLAADLTGVVQSSAQIDPAVPGNAASAVVQVQNIGNQRANATTQVGVYASLDATLGAGDVLLGSANTAGLNAGQSRNVTVNFTVPSGLTPSSYTLLAKVDNGNAIAENSEANNISARSTPFSVTWQFGNVPGRAGNTTLTLRDADGTMVTFGLSGPGRGEVIQDGVAWDLKLTGTTASSDFIILTDRGGNDRVTVNDIHVHGSIRSVQALTVDLTGTLAIDGPVSTLSLGSATGAVIAAPSVQTFVAQTLVNTNVFIGAVLGEDGKLGGTGVNADSFGAGRIGLFVLTGSMSGTTVRVGVDPVDGVFGNGNDVILGGTASSIGTIVSFGSLSADSRFLAGSFPSRYSTGLFSSRPTAGDPHFSTDPNTGSPTLSAVLLQDTGSSNNDRYTNNPAITGSVNDPQGIVTFTAGFGAIPTVNVLSDRQSDGSFTFSRARLEQINGGPLTDGPHTLTLRATDTVGNSTQIAVSLTLDTTIATLTVDLAPAFDTPPVGDQQTTQSTISVIGQTESNALIELIGLGLTGTADGSGNFTLSNVALALGANSFTVRATDAAGNQRTETRTFTRLAPSNQAPVLTSIGSKSVAEGLPLDFTATANEPDAGQTLTFSVENGTSGAVPVDATINPTSGAFSWTPTEAQGPGTYTFDVVVTDNGAPTLSDRETITVTVGEVNQAPTLDPIGTQTVTASQLLSFTAVGSDGDVPANTLTYSLQGTVPAGASINSTTGAFSWTPTAAQIGPQSVTVRVTDNGTPALFAEQVVSITVAAIPNQAPVLATIGNQTIDEGQALTLTATATDPNAGQTRTFSLENGTSGAIPAGAGINPTTGAFSWTPTEGQGPGTFTFDVVVTDNGAPILSDRETITVTVNEVNQAPTLSTIGNQTVNEGALLTFTATATDGDVPADTLTYSLQGTVPAGASINPTTGAFTWTPTAAQIGPHSLTIRVTDTGSPAQFDEETLTVTVGEVNEAPTLTAIGPQTIDEGQLLTFTATASEPDAGQTLTFSFANGTSGQVPAGATINPATGAFSWTPTELQGPGTYTFDVVVTDNGAPTLSDRETIVVTVNEVNQAPTLEPITAQTVTAGQLLSFAAVGSDPDVPANTLTYSLQGTVPAGASINPTTGAFTWTPTVAQIGPQSVTVRVTDNGTPAFFAEQVVSITVAAVPNQAPVLSLIGNQTISEHLPFTFTATANDPDAGQTLTFSLAPGASGAVPAGATINPTTGAFSWAPTELQGPGTYTFDVVVTDNGSPTSSDRETITVTVTEANAAPVLLVSSVPIGQVDSPLTPVGAVGRLVRDIVKLAPGSGPGTFNVSDSDAGAVTGIAISTSVGLPLWYSLDNGTTWVGFSPSASNVRLLAADASTRLYVSPPSIDFAGTRVNEFMFQAWDRTVGTNGGVITTGTLTGTGPTGAFSSGFAQATVVFIEDQVTNQAPVLAAIGNQTVGEGQALTLTATASDPNAGQTLTFSLANGTSGQVPAGATINPASGAFSWTPTELQGPGTYTFDVVVTDNGAPTLSDRETITVTVNEVNQAPTLTTIGNQAVNEGALLTFTATATDGDVPANTLTYSLQGTVPAGASINPTTGAFTWTPTAAQIGPHSLTIRVTDTGSPAQFDEETLTVTVGEVNEAPTLTAIGPQTIDEGQLLTFTATASDPDAGQTVTFSLENGTSGLIPAGATINPTTGAFSWTPTELQGSGTYTFDVVVTDNGSPALTDRETITVTVGEVNQAPTLDPIAAQTVTAGQLLSFAAVGNDLDVPANTLTYSLQGTVPAGANINPTTGAFTWTPTVAQIGPQSVTVRVTDNGTPALFAEQVVSITVSSANQAPVAVDDTFTMMEGGSFSGVPFLVKDINPGLASSTPTQLVNVNGTLYFTASQSGVGIELWKSDGTAAGTVLVKDIVAGSGSSDPANLTNVNGTLFFTAFDSTNGMELWKSDGTAAGTVLVKDISAGSGTSGPQFLTNVNGTLYFTASQSGVGIELWKSDGTAAGTVLVANISPSGSSNPGNLTDVNGTLFFTAIDGVTGRELWKSDGTAAGTVLVKDISTGAFSASPDSLTNVNGTLFFSATDGFERELWKSNGTAAGTVLVKNLNGGGSSNPASLINVNGTLFFQAVDVGVGTELFKSDGTAAGTVLVKDLFAGSSGSNPINLTNVGGKLFLRAFDPAIGQTLWVSDGTEAGTIELAPGGFALPGLANVGSFLTDVNGTAYFSAGGTGNDLWKSDGTLAGTVPVMIGAQPQDLTNVNGTLFFSGVPGGVGRELMKLDGQANVLANDSDPDGNPLTAILVSGPSNGSLTLNADGTFNYTPNSGFTGTDSFTYKANDGALDSNVATVTISVTTAPVVNQAPVLTTIGNQTIDEGQALSFTATANEPDAGQTLTFSLENGVSGAIPAGASINPTTGAFSWTPTEAQGPGTLTFDVVVTDNGAPTLSDRETIVVTVNEVNLAPVLNSIGNQTVTEGALLTFTATASDGDLPANTLTYSLQGTVPVGALINPATGEFTWTPTAAHIGPQSVTVRVTDNGTPALFDEQVVTITVSSSNQAPVAVGDAFHVQEGSGLIVGTSLLKDIAPGVASLSINNVLAVGDRLFFAISNGAASTDLWTSDGTAAGTVLVKSGFVGSSGAGFFGQLVDVSGTLFFKATDSVNGTELWKSDGTPAGTQLVKDVLPGIGDGISLSGGFNSAANVNGTLYFVGIDATTGFELWKTDGTAAGTVLVKDIVVGASSRPSELTNVNGTLFFVAQDNVAGSELFRSDGTAAGTVVVRDINVGGFGSNPRLLTNVNGTLFFVANDGVNGNELWKSDGTAAGTVLVTDITTASTGGPSQLISVGNRLFFTVDDGVHSSELWTSDGTAAGTAMVKDIVIGGGSSAPSDLINVNGTLFFSANDGVNGRELWKSDGTAAGTVLVKDIIPGAGGSIGIVNYWQAASNGELFFTPSDGVTGTELWKSDGTVAGTVLVKNIAPVGSSFPAQLTNVNGTVFFTADDNLHGRELWKTGGSETVLANDSDPEGSALTAILVSGPSNGTLTLNADGTFNYTPNSGFTGIDSFTYKANDGSLDSNVATVTITVTAAPVLNQAPALNAIGNQSIDEGQLLNFTATASDPDAGQTLTFSLENGTSGAIPAGATINPTTGAFSWTPTEFQGPGTYTFDVVVTDNGSPTLSDRETIVVTVNEVNQAPTLEPITAQTVTAGQLLSLTAVGSDPDVPANTLTYSLQGTVPAGASINPTTGAFTWTPTAAQIGPQSVTVRVTDNGTPALFAEQVVSITVSSANQAPVAVDDTFTMMEGGSFSGVPFLVKDINPGLASSTPTQLVNVNGTLYFTASQSGVGIELWKSDGTAAGTVLVRDIVAGSGSSDPANLTNVNGTLFFTADDGVSGRELWKSDGTAAGTVLVRDIHSGSTGSGLDGLTSVNGTLFFAANDGPNGIELWKSDGTAAGTGLVKNIGPFGSASAPQALTNVGGMLFFVASDSNGTELWKSDGTAAGTVLVKDISTGAFSASPDSLINVNGTLFFSATDGFERELWKSNGTAAGTVLVKNLNGGGSSNPASLINVNGTLFFQAVDVGVGTELFKSDGTAAGTVLVKDLFAGSSGSSPINLTNVGGKLFLRAFDPAIGQTLWVSDGTEAGTIELAPGGLALPGLANVGPFLTDVNGTAYFSAGGTGNDLWKSNGTVAGTVPVMIGAQPQDLTNVNGTLFFSGVPGGVGRELMKLDGQANVLANDSDPDGNPLTAILVSGPTNGSLTLNADGTFNYTPNSGFTGTDSFTYKANDGALDSNVATVTISVTAAPVVNQAPVLTTIGNQTIDEGQALSFTATANEPDAGQTLTFSLENGTSGTIPAGATINPTTGAFSWTPTELQGPGTYTFDVVVTDNGAPTLSDRETITVTVNEVNQAPVLATIGNQTVNEGALLTFTATATDGDVPANTLTYTLQGTIPAGASINPTTGVFTWTPTAAQIGPHSLTVRVTDNGTPALSAEETITVTVSDVNATPTATNDAYTLQQGSTLVAGTLLVKDILAGAGASNPANFTVVNGNLFFTASDSVNGTELWRSDGTAAGTMLVKDIRADSSFPTNLTNVNGTLFFTANDGVNGIELWKSDGTAPGTFMVKDVRPGNLGSSLSNLTNLNGLLFFWADDGVNGIELWKSDGTETGTVLVRDINPGASSGRTVVRELEVVGDTIFFTANDGVSGNELWKTDGTVSGTTLVADINPGLPNSTPQELTNINGTLFFSAARNGLNFGQELWKSDGTAAGTTQVMNIHPTAGSNPQNLTNFNGSVFFSATDGSSGTELWKSDGTTAGTILVKDISLGSGDSFPAELVSVNGILFFNAITTVEGSELWKSDGTAAGTVLVKDIKTGPSIGSFGSGLGGKLTNVNGTLFFIADDGAHGLEVWKSDGTEEGTVLVRDINAGSAASTNSQLVSFGGNLFFRAINSVTGAELWASGLQNDLLANDNDPDSPTLTATLGTGPTNGSLVLNADGTFTYRPNAGFTGTDTFTYRVSDGATASNLATVTITVG